MNVLNATVRLNRRTWSLKMASAIVVRRVQRGIQKVKAVNTLVVSALNVKPQQCLFPMHLRKDFCVFDFFCAVALVDLDCW